LGCSSLGNGMVTPLSTNERRAAASSTGRSLGSDGIRTSVDNAFSGVHDLPRNARLMLSQTISIVVSIHGLQTDPLSVFGISGPFLSIFSKI
jgi:hypothetical protein